MRTHREQNAASKRKFSLSNKAEVIAEQEQRREAPASASASGPAFKASAGSYKSCRSYMSYRSHRTHLKPRPDFPPTASAFACGECAAIDSQPSKDMTRWIWL